jgi:hypothetical protein
MNEEESLGEPRWSDYVLERGAGFQGFWAEHLRTSKRSVLFVLPRSFDPRSPLSFVELMNAGGDGPRDVLLLEFLEGDAPRPADLSRRVAENLQSIEQSLGSRGQIQRRPIQFYSEGRRIASQEAARVFSSLQDIEAYSDIIVDISGMPRSVFFPLVARLLHLVDHASTDSRNLFILVAEDPLLDANIIQEGIDELADYLAMFRDGFDQEATADRPRVWLPLLGESRVVQLTRIYNLLNPDETSPILPSPSRNPRRGDDLVVEYREFLFDQLRLDPRDFIYAAEENPFEVYRKIRQTILRYRQALASLGGCKVAISALSSKLMSTGALLAAYELKQAKLEVGVAHVDCQGYRLTQTETAPELFALWLAGECYAL